MNTSTNWKTQTRSAARQAGNFIGERTRYVVEEVAPVAVRKIGQFLPCLLAVAFVFAFSSFAFAEGEMAITEVIPQAEWTTMITDLGTKLGAVVKAMLGLSVGLLIVGILYSVVKKYARRGA